MSLKENLRKLFTDAGACAVGFSAACEVEEYESAGFRRFLSEGRHADMSYLERNASLRNDPRTLLEGARTVISLAFSYWPGSAAAQASPVALYALGRDYHKALRSALKPVCRAIEAGYGCQTRICVDSAPIAERYWAYRAGLGVKGLNGCLIIPGKGSYVVLAEVLTTLAVEADRAIAGDCGRCGSCMRACPTGALSESGLDARKCLSYLTIEHKGMWPKDIAAGESLFGCDRCQKTCPHNRHPEKARLQDFLPRGEVLSLTAGLCLELSDSDYSELTRGSALARAGASGLRRNAAAALGIEQYD